MKMDLHIHSIYSDGSYDLETIIKQAKDLDLFALTDHNTLKGNLELQKLRERYSFCALAGIEMSVEYKGKEIHLLGYFPLDSDFNGPAFNSLNHSIKLYHHSKIIQIQDILDRLHQDYSDLSYDDFIEYMTTQKENNNYNRVHIARYLIYRGKVNSINEAFKSYIGENCPYYVNKRQILLTDAFKLIKEAGGFPSIAHLIQYHMSEEEIEEMLIELGQIDPSFGIELFHYDHSKEDIIHYMKLTYRIMEKTGYNIIYTAGSDCHGENKVNRIGIPYAFEYDELYDSFYQKVSEDFIYYATENHLIREEKNNGL